MSWKRIKSFLIILFLLINILLIVSSDSIFFLPSWTKFNRNVINGTIDILDRNYGISVAEDVIPSYVGVIDNVDVTNIIYTREFDNISELRSNKSTFYGELITDVYSYNEQNSLKEIKLILERLNIDKDSYKIDVKKIDKGILCNVYEYVGKYKFFNANIKALFTPGKIKISGQWYIVQNKEPRNFIINNTNMADITGVLLDLASISASDKDQKFSEITGIKYGYHLSYYDINTATKTAPAVPCYMIETDIGSEYYYDAISGLLIKQEE